MNLLNATLSPLADKLETRRTVPSLSLSLSLCVRGLRVLRILRLVAFFLFCDPLVSFDIELSVKYWLGFSRLREWSLGLRTESVLSAVGLEDGIGTVGDPTEGTQVYIFMLLVELKKQSSCLVRLSNKSNEYVAFKVKTTSPKRYCVRPNTGVIMPRSTCDFTVTMQAQRTAPPDMQVKDKFLVQSTIVPFGSTDEDITSTFFSKESGSLIEECKLKVVLVSPPHSPVLQPFNGTSKQEAADASPRLKPASVLKESPMVKEASSLNDEFSDDKNFNPSPAKEVEDLKSKITILESKLSEAENVEDLKSKINTLHSKLSEADKVITMLKEEKTGDIRDRDISQQELILLRRKAASKVQAGFPTFFVVFILFVGIAIGYLLRP
ncbi:hypothetical protein IEQ34_000683 [Dendrobium chrysotoxum]|uniref:MSP domain-containing protein n=1 Tax=Dendrobium chrysotoxum TaxID=161865 RepID=A0AAV7HUU5_DENCH|nr:hypothetical protein IEQ34_000683 [Dendrobium chrysotoxum]